MGTDNLYVYDLKKKEGYYLTESAQYTQFSNPRFSPNGQKIVVSQKNHEEFRNIVVYSKTGKLLKKLTNNKSANYHPIWDKSGSNVYYSSYASGIPNIYKVNYGSRRSSQITNVLMGVYQPQLSPDGKTLYAKYYTSHGSDIYSVSTSSLKNYAYASYTGDSSDAVSSASSAEPLYGASSVAINSSGGTSSYSSSYGSGYQNAASSGKTVTPINASAGIITEDDTPAQTVSSSESGYESQLQKKKTHLNTKVPLLPAISISINSTSVR